MYHPSLSDAAGSSSLVAAVTWVQNTVLGTVASSVAITAVAWVGMMMLAGRVEIRRGLTVVAGCFVLFGATSIVAGIQATAGSGSTELAELPQPVPVPRPPPPQPRNRDPYAGASIAGP